MALIPSAQAANLPNWLDDALATHDQQKATVSEDKAELLTLEKGETEMYPKISPDGKYLLVASRKKNRQVITRRLVENGDPINVVSYDDEQALHSIAWHGDANVTFLSHRADSLGLWQKPVDGGVTQRLNGRLDGELKTPIVLEDGSIIAVRLQRSSQRMGSEKKHSRKNKLTFANWKTGKKQPHIVKISPQGVESMLSSGINPALSPDGKRIVFSMQAGRSWHLFMINVDGSDLAQLTESRSVDVQPTWSPDGKWIAFTSNRGNTDMRHANKGNWDIWLIGDDGRNMSRLTTHKAKDGAASFADNGRVYFHSDRKVSKKESAYHQVHAANKGFHIWSVLLPN